VTLPFAVILTAHRLHPSLHPAQQTALSLGVAETSKGRSFWFSELPTMN
jgi:hypothetical protein